MPALIPLPNSIEWGTDHFLLTEQTAVGCAQGASAEELEAALGVRRLLSATTGLLLPEGRRASSSHSIPGFRPRGTVWRCVPTG